MYRCIVGFRTMGPVDILSPAGGQLGTMRVFEHWPPGSLCGEGGSGGGEELSWQPVASRVPSLARAHGVSQRHLTLP